jgi:ubiquinone/menaquinone biosynthesis C-methylase UbiE
VYNKEYAIKWLKYAESGQDMFRKTYLFPYLEQTIRNTQIENTQKNSALLDIGCGWGGLLDYLPEGIEYVGVDPVKEFFSFIREQYADRALTLKQGQLPNDVPVANDSFDIVVCSMALHCVADLESSVNTIFAKAKLGGQVIIADFRDKAPPLIKKTFLRIDENKDDYVKGLYKLSNNTSIIAEAYFHNEKPMEKAIRARGRLKKTFLGPLFVGYNAVRLH